MQILPIASGKGGVGKSLVAANLSIALAEAGKRVVLADLDLGASNLHLIIGFNSVRKGVGSFLNNPELDFSEIILKTDYPNLRFIPGDAEIPGMANVKTPAKNALIKRLLALDADYLILDLGAGSGVNTMDFFLTSGGGIVVTAPTLTATLNAYIFLKNAVFRILSSSFRKNSFAWEYLESLRKDGMSLQKIYIPALLEHIRFKDPDSYDTYKLRMANFKPKLIVNLLDDPRDGEKASRIRRSCKEYLDIDVEHLGVIYRDHLQDIALSARLPIVKYKPDSVLSQAIHRIADKVLQTREEDASLLDFQSLDESYETALMEAEVDFEAKMHEMQNLLHSGVLTEGDLIETIRSQQYEITTLKKENQLLKARLVKAMESGFRV